MTKAEYIAFHKAACETMHGITKRKNADYTGEGDNPFANFERVEALGITDTLRGVLVRMTDKLARLTSFAQKGILEVSDESVADTCQDLANYSIIFAAIAEDLKNAAKTAPFDPEEELHGKPEYERRIDAIAR